MAGEFYGEDGNPPQVDRLIEELVAVYSAAGERLQKELEKATLTTFQKFRYRELLRQVDAYVDALQAELEEVVEREVIKQSYEHGVDIAQNSLRKQKVTIKPKIDLGSQVHTRAVQTISEGIVQDMTKANEAVRGTSRTILRDTQQKLIQESQVNRMIQDGILQGSARRDVSSRLAKELQDRLGKGKLLQAGSKWYTPAHYAELVVRTKTREAVTEGTIRTCLEYGIDLVRISVHADSCPICANYQGKVYSISGKTAGYPPLAERPPYHPFCRHVLTAHVPRKSDAAAEKLLQEVSQSKEPVTGVEQYRELLRDKSAKQLSQHAGDKVARNLLQGRAPTSATKGNLTARVRDAQWNSEKSLNSHIEKRVKEGQFSESFNSKKYQEVIQNVCLNKDAQVAVYNRRGGSMVAVIAKMEDVVPPELRGAKTEQLMAVFLSADRGKIITAYQASSLGALDLGDNPLWL